MKMLKKIFRYFKRRKTVKKVNKSLMIKLHKWQIDFIFDGKPYSEEVRNERCNGKTTAHILRICLKATNADIKNLLREGNDSYLYIATSEIKKLKPFAGDDNSTDRRMMYFLYELYDTYSMLACDKTMEGELRDIRFAWCKKGSD